MKCHDVTDGKLWHRQGSTELQVVCGAAAANKIIAHIHNEHQKPGCCKGINRTREILTKRFFWKGMSSDVGKYIAEECGMCSPQTRRAKSKQSVLPEQQSMLPEQQSVLPEQQSWLPEQQSMVPEQQSIVPEQQSMVPEQQSWLPEQQSMVPERQTMNTEQQSSLPEQQTCCQSTASVPSE
ncbi:glutenin, low molecular weight subunit 1D1 isoform X2 [Hyalella azteca]|uniref:Glutenin, low molecular weight subunit 1D1 isoform X2 n=1 Tax=Hyalella azteca TaxID=294128 RepID=A0A8B7PG47_HYAAZ|nr:glutenin, low molecular weight subunit 1D1 isoform X2 [Hyalella azteca]